MGKEGTKVAEFGFLSWDSEKVYLGGFWRVWLRLRVIKMLDVLQMAEHKCVVNTCCCGCSLRSGTLAIAIFNLVSMFSIFYIEYVHYFLLHSIFSILCYTEYVQFIMLHWVCLVYTATEYVQYILLHCVCLIDFATLNVQYILPQSMLSIFCYTEYVWYILLHCVPYVLLQCWIYNITQV